MSSKFSYALSTPSLIPKLTMIIGTVGMLGCASMYSTDTRETSNDVVVYKPRDTQDSQYKSLNVDWAGLSSDRSSVGYNISLTTIVDEYSQTEHISETRLNKNPDILTMWPVFLLVYPFLNCLSSTSNCFSEKKGEWTRQATRVGDSHPTGQSPDRDSPLQLTHAGKLTVTGYDKSGKVIGTYTSNTEFKHTNSFDAKEIVNKFNTRPESIVLDGVFTTNKGKEKFKLTGQNSLVAQINFGEYAWKSRAEIAQIERAKIKAACFQSCGQHDDINYDSCDKYTETRYSKEQLDSCIEKKYRKGIARDDRINACMKRCGDDD